METKNNRSGNRLELLLFCLKGEQRFGINVLKMQEVIPIPALTQIPNSHPAVRGMAHLRGIKLPIVDLSQAIKCGPLPEKPENLVIITEFNRKIQGFVVSKVDRIEISNWQNVLPPPRATAADSYLSGVIQNDNDLIQILDVERVLEEVLGIPHQASEHPDASKFLKDGQKVLVVDDSIVALKQICRTLDQINIPYVTANNGKEALDILNREIADSGQTITETIPMLISDIEMPEMDGYSLVKSIRGSSSLSDLYILVHTSLHGSVNTELARNNGANEILEKFVPEELAMSVAQGLMELNQEL